MARDKWPVTIDWDEFDKLLSYQCTQIEIADFFECSVDTIDNHCRRDRGMSFSDIWNKKKALGKIRLRKMQFALIERGGPGAATMAIYLDKKIFPLERIETPAGDAPPTVTPQQTKKTFEQFCETAGYPKPYPRQIEMSQFGINDDFPRMILGSRGYGKTDYITILGIAYAIYLNPDLSFLFITKSKDRNTAIMGEIETACEKSGVIFEKKNSTTLKVAGQHGKDPSVSCTTIKTKSLRGRHPFQVLMDDPVTEDDVSEATRRHVKRIYNEVNKLTKNILIIGQPAHKNDLYAELRPRVKKMEVPFGSIPELDPDLEAQRLAGVDEDSISASYFLKVITEGVAPFDKVRYIDAWPTGGSAVAFFDPSNKGVDLSAISIVKQHMQGVAAVGFTWKRAWNHCLDEAIPLLVKYGVKKLCFETNSTGDQPVEQLRGLLKNHGIGVVGKHSHLNKHAKIMSAGTYAHLIHLSRQSSKVYIEGVTKYEYGYEPDDAPDSLASCLEWIGLIRGKI